MITTIITIAAIAIAVSLFMRRPVFGKLPSGSRLAIIKASPHYKGTSLQNKSFTPALTEGASFFGVLKEFMSGKGKRRKPVDLMPSRKTDLLSLPPGKNVLVWFGHSSYFLQIDGKKMLVDPVFSGSASPIGTTRSFPGSDVYDVEDIPELDYLFLTHDHYDHLDYKTIIKLKTKVKKIITALGVGAHLEHWGFDKRTITETDWNTFLNLDEGFNINTTTARHFSGRTFKRNQSLWQSFVLTTPSMRLFLGGDSGYDTHFAEIGRQFGPFDLAILECGQYDKSWKYIHMQPAEVVQAAQDLKTKALMPVHWGKFQLANHAWDAPITNVTRIAASVQMPVVTPMIGEEVNLKEKKNFPAWWEQIR